MKIKSYFADSVEAALAQARTELGVDAMLISSHRNPEVAAGTGKYEVVFGLVEEVARPTPVAAAPAAPPTSELSDIRKQIGELQAALLAAKPQPRAAAEHNDFQGWTERLRAADLSPDTIQSVLEEAQTRFRAEVRIIRPGTDVFSGIIRQVLADRLQIADSPASDNRVMALVGPPGAGKTTTLIKLAVREGLKKGKSVHIIASDHYRVAACEQLRIFASVLGVGFQTAETFGALMQAMKDSRQRDLVLIDTPGFSAAEEDFAAELAGYFSHFSEITTHLVLSAAMKTGDLARCADRYKLFQPATLMFTRLDETATWGGVYSECLRLATPLSFTTCGQSIPEDLDAANGEALLERLLGPAERAVSVA